MTENPLGQVIKCLARVVGSQVSRPDPFTGEGIEASLEEEPGALR